MYGAVGKESEEIDLQSRNPLDFEAIFLTSFLFETSESFKHVFSKPSFLRIDFFGESLGHRFGD